MKKTGRRNPEGGGGECCSCLRLRLTSVLLRFSYLGFLNDSPGAKTVCIQNGLGEKEKKSERRIRREAAPS